MDTQRDRLFKTVEVAIRENITEEGLNENQPWSRIGEAGDVLHDIIEVLVASWDSCPEGKFWGVPDLAAAVNFRFRIWADRSSLDSEALQAAALEYLKRPRMQTNSMDWYLLNGFIHDSIARTYSFLVSGEATGNRGRMLAW